MKLPPLSFTFATNLWKLLLTILAAMIVGLWIKLTTDFLLGTPPPIAIENRIYAATICLILTCWLFVRRFEFARRLDYWSWHFRFRRTTR